MKIYRTVYATCIICLIGLFGLMFTTCKKDENGKDIDDDLITLNSDYSGEFFVDFENTVPPWSERSGMMQVTLLKSGVITIAPDSLSYFGDTIIQGQSKIERFGKIELSPEAKLKKINGEIHVMIDPVLLVNDHQIFYAWDGVNGWVVYNEVIIDTLVLHDELPFSLSQAVADEATRESADMMGSFKFTLRLNED